jgi:hypothetical protein
MVIKYFNIIDENIKSKILEYLTYKNVNSIKTLDKNFSNFLKKYQNYKLSYEINRRFITNNIKETIYKKLYSQSYILENIFDKSPNIFINNSKFDNNLIEVYLINEDFEYKLILTNDVDILNRIEYLYYGGEIYIFFKEEFMIYNLLDKKWSYHKIINEFNYLYTKYELLNNRIHIVQSFWDPRNNLTSSPLAILGENKTNSKLDISTKNIIPRKFYAIAQFEGKLWVAGGIDDNNYLSSIEVFDEDKNVWTLCYNMNKARINFKLIVHDNNLYAVGGDVNSITTIEKFDVIERKWNIITQLNVNSTNCYISLVNSYIFVCNKNILSNDNFKNNLLEEYYKEKVYSTTYIFDINSEQWNKNIDNKILLPFI